MFCDWLFVLSIDASTYAHFLFNAFDTDHNGSVSFEVSPELPGCSFLSVSKLDQCVGSLERNDVKRIKRSYRRGFTLDHYVTCNRLYKKKSSLIKFTQDAQHLINIYEGHLFAY